MRSLFALVASGLVLVPLARGAFDGPDDTPPRAATDETTEDFLAALELQRKGRFASAKRIFERILEKHPDSVHYEDALARGGDNAYLGTEVLWKSGPSERRIDVSVMGDGFTIDGPDQKLEKEWAELCLEVLWNEVVFDEYKRYFNYYFVRLASLEEGVDPNLSPEERAKIEERNKKRRKKKKIDFSTALDCKAAPGGQVYADRTLVYKWLGIAGRDEPGCGDDGLVIAFARFGQLGMGGGGVANVGRPDKSITVHEFGHAFCGLLDEYTGNPGPPGRSIRAANASTTDDPEEVPWAHFLEQKVKGVGIYEGGATYSSGVWRPANGCAMNSAGNNQFCPVCREAAVLAIYRHVSPIDTYGPGVDKELFVVEGAREEELFVQPMTPEHDLRVTWYVERLGPVVADAGTAGAGADADDPYAGWTLEGARRGNRYKNPFERGFGGYTGGSRHREDRSAYDEPPPGDAKKGRVKKGRSTYELAKLDPGRYAITAEVRDPIDWVLLDEQHLLAERVTWTVTVEPRSE